MTLPIKTTNLRKRFGSKIVLDGIDLEIEPGTIVGLLGKNGSGKSTLIQCLLGVLRSTGGQSHIFGERAQNLPPETKARIGYVAQEVVSFPWMRVKQVCAYFATFYPSWNQPLVDQLCQRWHLPVNQHVGTLSVGQLQTLGIVLALGHEPELLILDEPVSSLDPNARRQFLQTLLEINERSQRTILFSTHITSDLERIASHVAILRHMKIAYYGEIDALKDRVKRLHIKANQPLPADFFVPGSLHTEIANNIATVSVADFDEQLVHQLRATWHANITVHALNLEDIFVELHAENTTQAQPT